LDELSGEWQRVATGIGLVLDGHLDGHYA
jgi:hypothetical protein